MATFVRMPQKSLTEESAILSSWYVKEGDAVSEGQFIFAIETGKATFEIEAGVSGTILKIIAAEGDEIPIKRIVCVIGTPGEAYTLPAEESAADSTTAPAPVERPAVSPVSPALEAARATQREDEVSQRAILSRTISPRARRLAAAQGLDCSRIAGTGPGGRVIEDDVKAALAASPSAAAPSTEAQAAGEYSVLPFTPMRRAIASAMQQSLTNAAQFTMHAHCDATELLAYRERYNAACSAEEKLSIGDFIAFTLSRTLLRFPHLNAHSCEDSLRLFSNVNLGIAVDTPRGLLVPVLRSAQTKSLSQLSGEIKTLALRCRDGKALPGDLSNGTFTLSNMGARRVNHFTPILNPPQTGILGAGTIEFRRKMIAGQIADYPALSLSLTVDHRVVDGVPAADFLGEICEGLETFPLILI